MVALAPIVAPRLTRVSRNSTLRSMKARGLLTLVKTQEGPKKRRLREDALVYRDIILDLAIIAYRHARSSHDVSGPARNVRDHCPAARTWAKCQIFGAGADEAPSSHVCAFMNRCARKPGIGSHLPDVPSDGWLIAGQRYWRRADGDRHCSPSAVKKRKPATSSTKAARHRCEAPPGNNLAIALVCNSVKPSENSNSSPSISID